MIITFPLIHILRLAILHILHISMLLGFMAYSGAGFAEVPAQTSDTKITWGQCNANEAYAKPSPQRIINKPATDAVYLEADKGQIRTKGTSTLQGNIIIQQNDVQFNADSASYNRQTSKVTAKGNVTFSTNNGEFKSDALQFDLKKQSGVINQAQYQVGNDARGSSKQIQLIDRNHLALNDATFTTCPTPKNSWHFASSKINLNNETQIGTAKNVTLNVADTPVFYFPWLKFPLNNQRLSGFLTPNIRIQSNAGVSVPYYFNIAPNYDATVTLSRHADHGFELGTEFRYLTKKHQGQIDYEFIPEDKSFDDTSDTKSRDYFKINHHTKLSDISEVNLIAEGVSDKDFFNDFSTSLEGSSRSSLKRRLELISKSAPWTASAAIEDYQILDVTEAPYSRLPELRLKYSPKTKPKNIKYRLESELVYFDKDDAVTGSRAHLKLSTSKKWGNDAWYFEPKVGLQHTLYNLSNSDETSISRTLPTFTMDTGLFFDREIAKETATKEGDGFYTQTLEPRLFYTYTPFKDQSDIPIFDTSFENFSAANQLFSENRFTGKDRIEDNNQLTFAVTSRLQDRNTGKELLSASIGQVFNFNDKKVTLPNGTIGTGKRSDLVLELSGRLNDRLKIATTTLWSHDSKRVPSYELRLNYQDEKQRIANLRFRKLDTELKQLTLSGALPLNDKWSLVASSSRDLENDRNLEALVGIEYQDCCWKTRIVAKRYLTSDNETYETPIFLEFELKGLGNIGSGAKRELKDKIYGYDDY